MAEMKDGCVKPARGPLTTDSDSNVPAEGLRTERVTGMRAQVGKEAPDFEANAFVSDVGFKPVKLSDYKGSWIVLCFYPGDFTFV
jgi:peroxiredoxin (alkyl hydroperoxide reductase subunit C)